MREKSYPNNNIFCMHFPLPNLNIPEALLTRGEGALSIFYTWYLDILKLMGLELF